MSSHRRTRHRPGPLAFVVLGWLVISGGALLAHDPGLSSLDVSVTPNAISLSLSIAASDVALIAPSGDPRPQLRALAREAIRLSIDGETLSPLADEVLIKDGAAYMRLSFDGRPEGRHYGSPSERRPSDEPVRTKPVRTKPVPEPTSTFGDRLRYSTTRVTRPSRNDDCPLGRSGHRRDVARRRL